MWALLGKQLLKSGVKKVAKDKLLNRKKKTPKKRKSGKEVSQNIMSNGKEEQKKGGELTVQPSTGAIPSARDLSPVSTNPGESDIVIIKKQVIQVRDILKDSYTVEQAERVNQRKTRQTDKRTEREDKLEKPKVKPQESKGGMKAPSLGLGIGNFLTWLAVGVIFSKLKDLMPALKKIFRILGPIAKFIGGLFEKTIGFVVGFIDLAYAGVEKVREAIVAIGGEGAGEQFDKFGRLFTQLMNGALIAAQAALVVGLFDRRRGPKGPKGPKSKLRKGIERWFKKTPVGKFLRNQKATVLRGLRQFSKTPVGRTLNALRPKNVGKFIMEGGVDRTLKKVSTNLLKRAKNINVKSIREGISERMPKLSVPKFLQKGSGFRTAISTGIEKSVRFAQELPQKTIDAVKNIKWGELPLVKQARGAMEGFKPLKWLDDVAKNLSPGKMVQGLIDKAQPNIDEFLGKNPYLKKLGGKIDPKTLVPWIADNFQKFSKQAEPIAKAVKGNKALKSMSNFLGPVDIVIDSLFALVDYAAGGESLVNAVVKALSSSLGFAAGAAAGAALTGTATFFTAGAGAPLIPFVTFGMGMGGAILGEQLGNLILKALVQIPALADMDDPIAEEMGLSPRKIIRDPWGEKGEGARGIKVSNDSAGKTTSEQIASADVNKNKAEGLDGTTSYGSGGFITIENTTTYIQPIEV